MEHGCSSNLRTTGYRLRVIGYRLPAPNLSSFCAKHQGNEDSFHRTSTPKHPDKIGGVCRPVWYPKNRGKEIFSRLTRIPKKARHPQRAFFRCGKEKPMPAKYGFSTNAPTCSPSAGRFLAHRFTASAFVPTSAALALTNAAFVLARGTLDTMNAGFADTNQLPSPQSFAAFARVSAAFMHASAAFEDASQLPCHVLLTRDNNGTVTPNSLKTRRGQELPPPGVRG